MEYILYGFAVLFFSIWVSQFTQLMLLTDDNFPGQTTKALRITTYFVFSYLSCSRSENSHFLMNVNSLNQRANG